MTQKDQLMEELNLLRKKVIDLESDNRLFKKMEETGRIGGWQFDPVTLKQTWTDEVFRILEIDLEHGAPEVPKGLEFIDPEFRSMAEKAIQQAMEHGEPYNQEWIVTTAKGNKKWVNAVCSPKLENGNFVSISGSFQDITSKKIAEEDLKMSEQSVRAANQQLQAGEQQLKAANQQLSASEQQLRAVVQQLQSSEQQLRASNQQLKASEQQLSEAYVKINEREKYLQLINDTTVDQIYSYDLDNRFTSANKTLCDNLKLNVNDIIGKSYWELGFPDENCKAWDELHRKTYSTGQTTEIVSTPMPDGTTQYFGVNLFVLKDSDGTNLGIAGINRNITESKLAEKELIKAKEKAEESEYRLKLATASGQLGIWDWNLVENTMIWDDRMFELYGITRETFPNNIDAWTNGLHPEDKQRAIDECNAAIDGQREFDTSFRVLHPNGTVLYLKANALVLRDENKHPLRMIGINRDITINRLAEEALIIAREKAEENKEKFKLLNRLTSEMLLLQDMENIYKFITENLQKLYPNTIVLNISIDESIQQTRLEAISGLDNSLLMKVIKLTGFNPIGKTYKLIDIHNSYFKSGNFIEFDGGLAQFSTTEFPSFAATAIEKIIGLHKIYSIGINKDDGLLSAIHFITFNKQVITDGNFIEIFAKQVGLILQKKIDEKALMNAKERAEEADRLKSAFLANMSHEIRTPMNGILGFAELLKEPGLSGETQSEYIKIIEKSGARMLNTINDIVDISKIEAGLMKLDIKESNINEQIEYIYTFFKPEMEAHGMKLSFKNSLPLKEAIIRTDREKLYSILTNLVKNAIKYTDQGSIEFGYNLVETHGRASVQSHAGAQAYTHGQAYLQFYVKDTGIGIPADRKEAIFERFIQAEIEDKKARQGSGLGLAITKSYVEMLGGKIWVESEVEIGSTFYFTLPYHAESTEKRVEQNAVAPDTPDSIRKNLKILIAEDDEVSERLIGIAVKMFGKEILRKSKYILKQLSE